MGNPTYNRRNRIKFQEAEKRRAEFLSRIRTGATIAEACEAVGVTQQAVRQWRKRYPQWEIDLALARAAGREGRDSFDGSFISFRRDYLGMETTWFQARIADKIEHARPGEVTLILIPPEHGKTTLLEDWCTYKLVTDQSFRITVASETVDHGKKILQRVQHRLEPEGPTPRIHADFGPLAPQSSNQVWSTQHFDVAGRVLSDERDYSMHAVGLKGRVQGTRCDLLLLDDIQDVKSIGQSELYFQIITQSFLSRPSMFGRTVIIGTRVDEFDVYRLLMDAEIDDNLVRIAAYSVDNSPEWERPKRKPSVLDTATWAPEGMKFLWPEKYDDEPGDGMHRYRYAALRYRVGEVAWARNYMQHPEAAATKTFDPKTIDKLKDETRNIWADPLPRIDPETNQPGPVPVIIALDPAIGSTNAVLSAAMYPDRMDVLNVRHDTGLSQYAQIFDVLEEECHRWSTLTSYIELVVVEDKAFQKGIMRDDRMTELLRRFGCRVVPNTTGKEKVDPDIGIPSIPLAIWRDELTIPWSESAQDAMAPLVKHLSTWRPGVSGVKLAQDHVMTLWFALRQWRAVRLNPAHPPADMASFAGRASPLRKPRPRRPLTRTTYRRLGTVPNRRSR